MHLIYTLYILTALPVLIILPLQYQYVEIFLIIIPIFKKLKQRFNNLSKVT